MKINSYINITFSSWHLSVSFNSRDSWKRHEAKLSKNTFILLLGWFSFTLYKKEK